MNGAPDKIQIFKPFEESFAVTREILFQPFDLKKWFVIGFAAWLANLGGGSYNFNYGDDFKNSPFIRNLDETFAAVPHWLIFAGIAAISFVVLVVMIVFAWLRARGQFMFIDCIVKNRAAIAEPWHEFRGQGNSYFLLALVAGVVLVLILSIAALPFVVPLIRGVTFEHPNLYFILAIVFWALVLVAVIMAWSVISHFMVAIMYRRRCRAREGLAAAVSLIANYPGEITLYCLFWIVLAIAAGIASCMAILATCCIAILPYVGTVILLPLFVCLRAFGLRFIRQFGPEYDVWAGVPGLSAPTSNEPPPLPS